MARVSSTPAQQKFSHRCPHHNSVLQAPGEFPDKIHHHATPFAIVNSRIYAISSLRRRGSFEIYPVPSVDLEHHRASVRSSSGHALPCPQATAPAWCNGTMRWTRPAVGPMFWATDIVPRGMRNVTDSFLIQTSSPSNLNDEEKADFALFRNTGLGRKVSHDSCRNGPCNDSMADEQTVYSVPNSSVDVILYRGAGGAVPSGWRGDLKAVRTPHAVCC